jgi:hypothetical protein
VNTTQRAEQTLPVVRVDEISEQDAAPSWLIEDLWGAAAVGLIGGHPKCGKTWLGLDLALSVASGTLCLGNYRVLQPGRVLVYLAEDTLSMVRQRIQAMAKHRGVALERLDFHVITASRLQLDDPQDRARLFKTVWSLQPRLLLLDPLVRLHRANENDAAEMAHVLSGLRELQKRFHVAIVVVHHTRKNGGAGGQPGQALRGSSDLWAWSDSNLYLRRTQRQLLLSMEHRAAGTPDPIALRLADADAERLHLEVVGMDRRRSPGRSLDQEILEAVREVPSINRVQLRARLQVKNETLGRALERLQEEGRLDRGRDGWRLVTVVGSRAPRSPFPSYGMKGNGTPHEVSFR